jgi:hypothetical protein
MQMSDNVLTKSELNVIIHRFLKDENRGISYKLFADLAGIDESTLTKVFLYRSMPMSEFIQRRVSRAYTEWMDGRVAVMERIDGTRYIQYRREAKPRLARLQRLQVVNGKVQLKVGIGNRADYSQPTLDEQMRR